MVFLFLLCSNVNVYGFSIFRSMRFVSMHQGLGLCMCVCVCVCGKKMIRIYKFGCHKGLCDVQCRLGDI
jgi:hypothetical protein